MFRLNARIATAATAAAAALTVLGLAQPASAATNTWQPVAAQDPGRHCARTVESTVPNVFYQGCTIVTGHYVQLALVVTNDSNRPIKISGSTSPKIDDSPMPMTFCADANHPYTLNPGTRRGCFGETLYLNCTQHIMGFVSLQFPADFGDFNEDVPERSSC